MAKQQRQHGVPLEHTPPGADTSTPVGTSRAELLAALSLAIDLGLGQPMEHMLRATLLSLRMADLLGLDRRQRARIYYANLLAWIGCHADSHELARLFGDDLAFRNDYYFIDAHGIPMLSLMLRHTGTDLPPSQRMSRRAHLALSANNTMRALISSHCISAGQLATRVGLDPGMPTILNTTFERWDGQGLPAGVSGVEIPLEMRIAQLADTAEVFLRTAGLPAALGIVHERRGSQFDPELSHLFTTNAEQLTEGLLEVDPWPAALAAAPSHEALTPRELEYILAAMGDFADLKSPWTAGHSREVARLAASAGDYAGCSPAEIAALRHAGWVHDVGRMGVSNGVWDKAAPLTAMDRERLQLYPFLGARILNRVTGMRRVAELVGAHRERLDGSGYPQALRAGDLDEGQQILAAADSFQSSLEPRPHRAALTPQQGARRLRAEAEEGRLGEDAVEAVLAAAGQQEARRRHAASVLTPREREVLRLLCRGMDNRSIAQELVISVKTARNHVEHIYEKTGAANRVTATLFALDHDLWSRT